jgi:hypothetical protein
MLEVNRLWKKKRLFKSENIHKVISCPNSVGIYNSYMGGVDPIDSMLGYYTQVAKM